MIKRKPQSQLNVKLKPGFRLQTKPLLKFSPSKAYPYPDTFSNVLARPLAQKSNKQSTNHKLAVGDELRQYLYNSYPSQLIFQRTLSKSSSLAHVFSPLNYLLLFLKKTYLQEQIQTSVWRGRHGSVRQFKHFRQGRRARLLPRVYHRALKLPVFSLRFFYAFDVFVLWIYFFFKKIMCFIKLFVFEQWCNLYFFLLADNPKLGLSAYFFNRPRNINFRDCFENYILTVNYNYKALILAASRFSILRVYSFTSLFKLMCLFWNKRKYKHFIFRITARRWKRKFKNLQRKRLKKKRIPFWKRIKTTRFFLPNKILRLKFRRQHGYKTITDYALRTQLRRLKPKTRRKLPKINYPQRPLRRFSFRPPNKFISPVLSNSNILRFSKIHKVNKCIRLFLVNRRKEFLLKFTADWLKNTSFNTTQISNEMLLLGALCKSLKGLANFPFISIVLSYFNYLRSKQVYFKDLAKKPYFAPAPLVELFYGEYFWIALLPTVLAYSHKSFNPSPWAPFYKALNNHYRAKIKPLSISERKKLNRKKIVTLTFAELYHQFISKNIKIRHLLRLKRRAHNRKLSAITNRRKLLLAIKFKAILLRKQKAPFFCFRMPKRNLSF